MAFPTPPPLRGDRPDLRKESANKTVSTRVGRLSTEPETTPVDVEKNKPVVETEPSSPSEITPTATADSLFKMQSGLRLLETTDISSAQAGTGSSSLLAPTASSGNGRMYEPGFRLGLFEVRPGFSSGMTFSDNISAAPKGSARRRSDIIYNISPSIDFTYEPEGDTDVARMSFGYTPSLQMFQNNTSEDNINHSFNFATGYRFSKLNIGLKQTFYSLTGGDPTSGERVERIIFDTSVYSEYQLGEKTTIELSVGLGGRQVDSLTNFDTFTPSPSLFVNYDYTPKLKLGVGLVGTYSFVEKQADQFSIGPSVRALYDYSEKTKLFAQAGVSLRDYGTTVSNSIDGNFSVGANYEVTPLITTTLSARRSQQISNTLFGQNTINTGFSVGANYKLLQQIGVSLNLGYEFVEYVASISTTSTQREDEYYFINPGISYSPLEFWDLSFSYLFRENNSNVSTNTFDNNQFTLSSTLRF